MRDVINLALFSAQPDGFVPPREIGIHELAWDALSGWWTIQLGVKVGVDVLLSDHKAKFSWPKTDAELIALVRPLVQELAVLL